MSTGKLASHLDDRAVSFAEFLEAWRELARIVREFEPSVVVLVARKTARMQQVLDLDFGDTVLLISDLAIPFSREWLHSARVATVDDVVNVGSTLSYATERVVAAGAAEVRAFAITRLGRESDRPDGVEFALDRDLDRERLREFGRLVPRALRTFDKPYDLDFPVLRCVPQVPYSTYDEVLAALRDAHGESDVYDLSTRDGVAAGMRRLAIDLAGTVGAHRKIRIYFSDSGYCHVVPFDIAPVLKTGAPSARSSAGARAMYAAVTAGGPINDRDARARLRAYCESLSLGEEFLSQHSDVLRAPPDALDLDDAALVLGPRARDVALSSLVARPYRQGWAAVARRPIPSPFLPTARRTGLIDAMRARMRETWHEPEVLAALLACLETLADWVGADDPSRYRLGWPYESHTINRRPHLRLRIGPTMPDILEIVATLLDKTEGEQESLRSRVTRLLDRLIDTGAVVPTTARYDGLIYRIYRKGEGSPRDLVSSRIANALYEYQQATDHDLVATLMTKILTIMSFSAEEEAQPGGRPMADTRGNVVSYPTDLLDDGADIFYYLLQTERLRRTSDGGAALAAAQHRSTPS